MKFEKRAARIGRSSKAALPLSSLHSPVMHLLRSLNQVLIPGRGRM